MTTAIVIIVIAVTLGFLGCIGLAKLETRLESKKNDGFPDGRGRA